MSKSTESHPVTKIFYLEIDPSENLNDKSTEAGKQWDEILSISSQPEHGFQEQYWGRGLAPSPSHVTTEEPTKVRLCIVRDKLEQHYDFRASPSGKKYHEMLVDFIMPGTQIKTRHVLMEDNLITQGCRAFEAPVTGSALYRNSTDTFAKYAWPLWSKIVGRTHGVRGVAGGRVLASEDEKEAFLVYVGWETYEDHQNFRKSPLCADRRLILSEGNEGQVEYYHLAFQKGKKTQ